MLGETCKEKSNLISWYLFSSPIKISFNDRVVVFFLPPSLFLSLIFPINLLFSCFENNKTVYVLLLSPLVQYYLIFHSLNLFPKVIHVHMTPCKGIRLLRFEKDCSLNTENLLQMSTRDEFIWHVSVNLHSLKGIM
uniref:Uncharacterized protein n=1 Tax=Pipistrellus kuhlii TaxID=59472 RepID=A0A7J7UGG4_PIPKU|nr:hypothetical protein mPipKuh1_009080 [Pipistrellus kuhlii]